MDSGNSNEVNRNEKNHRPKELHKVQKSEERETSGVAVGQVIFLSQIPKRPLRYSSLMKSV